MRGRIAGMPAEKAAGKPGALPGGARQDIRRQPAVHPDVRAACQRHRQGPGPDGL